MMNSRDEEMLTRSFQKGFMEPMKEMVERFKTESDLREKVAESRYALTQKRLDSIEKTLERLLKIAEDTK